MGCIESKRQKKKQTHNNDYIASQNKVVLQLENEQNQKITNPELEKKIQEIYTQKPNEPDAAYFLRAYESNLFTVDFGKNCSMDQEVIRDDEENQTLTVKIDFEVKLTQQQFQ